MEVHFHARYFKYSWRSLLIYFWVLFTFFDMDSFCVNEYFTPQEKNGE
jgi:hypothetical protein